VGEVSRIGSDCGSLDRIAIFVPIPTHAVRYDTAEATRGHEMEIFWQALMGLGLLVAIVAFFVVPGLAYRIVRKHNAPQP
jgi:hypothetical protein